MLYKMKLVYGEYVDITLFHIDIPEDEKCNAIQAIRGEIDFNKIGFDFFNQGE